MSDTKKKGRTKKTPDEVRASFNRFTKAMGIDGLQLFVNDKDENDSSYGRSVVLSSTDGSVLFSNISGTELVSACDKAYELCQYATQLPETDEEPAAKTG